MLVELRVRNSFIFNEQIVFSLNADMRNKKFGFNVHKINNFNILKTAGIYGPNNVGKSCLVKGIQAMKDILLNEKVNIMSNLFTDNSVCELGITFLSDGRKYAYDLKYDEKTAGFVYEKFVEILKDQYGNEKEVLWLEKKHITQEYYCIDNQLHSIMPYMSANNLLCYVIDVNKFEYLSKIKNLITSFANKIDVVNMNNIPMRKTIELMKNKNESQKKVVTFIKHADLYMDNFEYVSMEKVPCFFDKGRVEEEVLSMKEDVTDQIRLVSTYKGVSVPSLIFDSTGTKKIAAMASYIIESLEQGKILVIDELDSSIHFKLTRAIVAMFNNELNKDTQLIFTVHDINLMDCKRLFRKEQIWFVHKDDKSVYVYSLADFTAQQGIRDTTDIIEKYKKGILGALPNPKLINFLLDFEK